MNLFDKVDVPLCYKGKIAEAHGGRILLSNREGGLALTMMLPPPTPT